MVRRRKLFARGGGATNQYGGVPSTIASNVVTALFTTTPHHPPIIAWTSPPHHLIYREEIKKDGEKEVLCCGAVNQYGVPSTPASNVVTAQFTNTNPPIIAWTSQKSWKMMATRKFVAGGATN
jgi:hypothetical protein